MDGKIRAEWEPLKKVIIHRPGIEMFFGLLDPMGSLYERAFSQRGAQIEHENLEETLRRACGVEVYLLKDLIVKEAEKRPDIRKHLVDMAAETIESGGSDEVVRHAMKEFEQNAKYLDIEHFFNIILLNPGIEFSLNAGFRDVNVNITKRHPLCNLYFMRDQQFVTDQGLVISRMGKDARKNETKLTKFLWKEVLQVPVIHEIQAPGTIEGGEFIPMGKFALVGIGSRTNQNAIDQLLSINFDFEELGVVHQPMHPLVSADNPDPMINMHLDTYFNVAASDVVVGNEELLKAAKMDIYVKEGNHHFVKKEKHQTNLYDYISKKGFHIVPITILEQMSYATNFLCIKNKKILAIEVERLVKDVLANLEYKAKEDPKRYGRLYDQAKKDYEFLKNEGQFFPHKKEMYQAGIDAYPIILKNLTGGYGGAHCMTCSLSREKE